MPATEPMVHIAGAGIGGLALAQVLRKHGIAYEVFERDESASVRPQGWALAMNWILPEIARSYPEDLPSIQQTSAESEGFKSIVKFWNGKEKQTLWSSVADRTEHMRANRAKLRDWHLGHLDVQWGKRFAGFDVRQDGRIATHFQDGETRVCDVLVGADGIRSQVRDALFAPNPPALNYLPLGVLAAEFDAPVSDYPKMEELGQSFCLAFADDCRFMMAPQSIRSDGSRYYWILTWPESKAVDQAFWTDLQSQSPEQWLQKAKEVASVLHPDFRAVIDAQDAKRMYAPFPVRDMVPTAIPDGRVTLLGDALHPMSPYGGEGGQSAIKDAIDLGEAIAKAVKAGGNLNDALKEYSQAAVQRNAAKVLEARTRTDHTQQPVPPIRQRRA
ncbi:hypothetical protein RI367_007014 [Sorochytrium milnesiophthora]